MSSAGGLLLPVVAALALGACSSDYMAAQESEQAALTTVPQNYRADILAFMRTYLNDPTQVRGAYVSEPALRTLDGASRYTVCLRYNAKKSGGQYAGSKDSIVQQVNKPRHGVMPPWGTRLTDAEIKQVTVYVHSLGGGQ